MPYEIYKILHVVSVVIFFASGGILLYGNQVKHLKIFNGVFTLFIFVSGMGLMARLGVGHGGSWPLWIKYKMFVWLLLAIAFPVVSKRFSRYGIMTFWLAIFLLTSASYMANYKL